MDIEEGPPSVRPFENHGPIQCQTDFGKFKMQTKHC